MNAEFSIISSSQYHFGNDPTRFDSVEPGSTFVGDNAEYSFPCANIDRSAPALLIFQSVGVRSPTNKVFINGQPLYGGLPWHSSQISHDLLRGQAMLITANVLKATGNVLRIEANNGGSDFIVSNIVTLYRSRTSGPSSKVALEQPGLRYTEVLAVRQRFGDRRVDVSAQQPGDPAFLGELDAPFVGLNKEYGFDCPGVNAAVESIALYQTYAVSTPNSVMKINGQGVDGAFSNRPGYWTGNLKMIPRNTLRSAGNMLAIRAGSLLDNPHNHDDFVLDNVVILYRTRGSVIAPVTEGSGPERMST